jgi:hypothetical protein
MLLTQTNEPALRLRESDRQYYGWRVVLAASVGVMVGFGSLFVYTFGVFVKPLATEFAWSREAISRGFSLAALTVAVCSPMLGHWLDRYGPGRIILPCLTLFGCGVASLGLLRPHLWQFYATCILLGAVGNGAAHFVLFACNLHLVSQPSGNSSGIRDGWGGIRLDDTSGARADDHKPFGMARGVSIPRRPAFALRVTSELALSAILETRRRSATIPVRFTTRD